MAQKGIAVSDYVDGQEPPMMDDVTALTEEVDRDFMNKLALTITRFEEVLGAGQAEMSLGDLHKFIDARGAALDMLDDPQLQEWLDRMRTSSRCPFRRFAVSG